MSEPEKKMTLAELDQPSDIVQGDFEEAPTVEELTAALEKAAAEIAAKDEKLAQLGSAMQFLRGKYAQAVRAGTAAKAEAGRAHRDYGHQPMREQWLERIKDALGLPRSRLLAEVEETIISRMERLKYAEQQMHQQEVEMQDLREAVKQLKFLLAHEDATTLLQERDAARNLVNKLLRNIVEARRDGLDPASDRSFVRLELPSIEAADAWLLAFEALPAPDVEDES